MTYGIAMICNLTLPAEVLYQGSAMFFTDLIQVETYAFIAMGIFLEKKPTPGFKTRPTSLKPCRG
jgi:hypothetical protein